MLEVKEIWKYYLDEPLLRGVSFSVSPEETVCLLGPSGSGKSTLLRIIAGLESPEKGQVCWDGEDLASTPSHRRGFGLVFQEYALFPHLNVFENVGFGLKMQGYSQGDVKMRVDDILGKVNLDGFSDRRVTELSGGEQQRVALARALASNPRLLMFDEPLGALDRSLREQLIGELRRILRSGGVRAIYVTHDQEEAFFLADRVLLLHEGVIVGEGTPAEIWHDPGSAWAAQFLDAGNLMQGVMLSSGLVKTGLGPVPLKCNHHHRVGDPIRLLVSRRDVQRVAKSGFTGVVTDVTFFQDAYKVNLDDGTDFYLPEAPQVGERIFLEIQPSGVKCLTTP
jgi:spermidine/putrescine transport system ATP-binding protein